MKLTQGGLGECSHTTGKRPSMCSYMPKSTTIIRTMCFDTKTYVYIVQCCMFMPSCLPRVCVSFAEDVSAVLACTN